MATSDTGSSFAQWADLYTYGPSNPAGDLSASDHSTSPPTLSGSDGSPARPAAPTAAAQQQQQQAGGPRAGASIISKTIKKRPSPRASRRAPVTLLNTDAANFRAMVQQFTGVPGPVASFASNDGYAFQVQQPLQPFAVSSLDHYQHQQQYTGGRGGAFGYGNALQQQAAFTAHHGLGLGPAEDRMLLQSMQQAAAQMPSRNGVNGYFA